MSQSLSGPIRPAPTGQRPPGGNRYPTDPRDSQIASLRKHFAAEDLQSTEVRCLVEEGEQLSKLLKKAFPDDNRDTWTYADLDDAVQKSRRAWESKERIGHGKPQKLFHTLMRKFDSHSNLFQFIPSGNLYASVVTGATAMLVKASVNHSKTIEELSEALDTITEAVSIGDVEVDLIKSTAMQSAVAKLYISIFLFLGDAATWYKSSAGAKVVHSFHKNFSERFRAQLETITKQAANVRYIAQLGSQAEVRVVRLEVEGLRDELHDIRIGLPAGFRMVLESLHAQHGENMKQHAQILELLAEQRSAGMLPAPQVAEFDYQRLIRGIRGADGIATWLEPPRVATPMASSEEEYGSGIGRDPSPAPSIPSQPSLCQQLEDLLNPEEPRNDKSQAPHPNAFDKQLSQSVNNWLAYPPSALLYLEYLSGLPTEDIIRALASQIITSSLSASIPVVPCLPNLATIISDNFPDRPNQSLAIFILSLAHQISKLDTNPPTPSVANWSEPTPLSETTFSTATSVLFSTLNNVSLPSKRLHIIIPGHPFLAGVDSSQLRIFLSDLKSSMQRSDIVLKVIVLTHLRLTNILPLLKPNEMALLRQQLGKHKGPKMPIVIPAILA